MEELRDNDGFIVLDKFPFEMMDYENNKKILIFYIEGVKYFFKSEIDINKVYNELIVEEIAKDFNIECVHYDLADYRGLRGVISEDFIKDNNFIKMASILGEYYDDNKDNDFIITTGSDYIDYDEKDYNEDFNENNNLMDIWSALDNKYKDEIISNKLMDEIVSMYLFDILIGNCDRHIFNYGIIEDDGDLRLAPIYDNGNILSHNSLFNGEYCIGVDEKDNIFSNDYTGPDNKFLVKFLKQSSSEYTDLLKSKLWVISVENIDRVLKRVEDRINSEISEEIKNDIKSKFMTNYENIKYTLEYNDERKL